ncbi:SET domain [Carpediemonas membranifera]|uniref:SET domain n=1 Tax=Carpediemonas membranifera TaxID=201153 RepID=A0A8J6BC39_9EUKA|nr:SET domain [Carpediemonas membranifera]|eukprot:KAG9394287.1 SET domain [Carpediemonas membranifera]
MKENQAETNVRRSSRLKQNSIQSYFKQEKAIPIVDKKKALKPLKEASITVKNLNTPEKVLIEIKHEKAKQHKTAKPTKPASFRRLRVNKWTKEAMALCPKPIMGTEDGPDDDCEVRKACMVECTDKSCTAGPSCGNRGLQRQEYAKYEIRSAGGKGDGFYAKEDIKAGELIIEYVGEVLTKEAAQDRLKHNTSRHVYGMGIGDGIVIDSAERGNDARFINHSCDPNAETGKWEVRGRPRVAVTARRLILSGEEVTFDYHFETEGEKVKCMCGSKKCRGYL